MSNSRVENFLKKYQSEIYMVLFLVLVGIISFNLGRIWTISRYGQPLKVEEANLLEIFKQNNANIQINANDANIESEGLKINQPISFKVVASKNGTKYHFLWCGGAKKIKPENLITFNTEQEAQAKGFTLAGNCQK